MICDRYQGKRLNSPNDVVVKSDGSIWFTDPQFGILGYYEGHLDTSELPMNVYRVDGQSGEATVVADGIDGAERARLLARRERSSTSSSRARRRARSWSMTSSATAAGSPTARRLIDAGPDGTPDGFRCDIDGNLWCGWGMTAELDGVRIFNPAGEPIGHIALPERCANLCFGGRYRNRLFMAASHSLYSLYVNTQGVAGG